LDSRSAQVPPPDAARQADARRFSDIRRLMSLLDYLIGGLLLLALTLNGFSKAFVGYLGLPTPAGAVIYLLGLMAAYTLITAPLDYITGYALPKRYCLSRQTVADWLKDHFKTFALGVSMGSLMVAAGYWLLTLTPLWWLWGWAAMLLVSLALTVLAPVLILPLFFKTTPMTDGEVKQRLEALAQKAGIKIKGIYVAEFGAKTTAANAALMGVGGTRRIIVSDTLLDHYSPPEIDVIMAHEMGHQRHSDMLRLSLFQSGVLFVTFALSSLLYRAGISSFRYAALSDTAALPWLIISFGLVGLFVSPLTASFTRLVESQADRYALETTNDPDSFISAMFRLTDQNLAEAAPPRWVEVLLDDHPSYRQRLAAAKRYKSSRPSG
jgi:STE24 endopeptidase